MEDLNLTNKKETIENLNRIEESLINELEGLSHEAESFRRARENIYYNIGSMDPETDMILDKLWGDIQIDDILGMGHEQIELMGKIADKDLMDEEIKSSDGTTYKTSHEEERKMLESLIAHNEVKPDKLLEKLPIAKKGIVEAGAASLQSIVNTYQQQLEIIKNDSIENRRERILQNIMEIERIKSLILNSEIGEIEQATEGVKMPEIDTELQAIRTERTQEKDNSIEERE